MLDSMFPKNIFGQFFCKELTENDLQDLGQFDVVLLNGVLHHMDDETSIKTLALAFRALRPGGRVITLDPCYTKDQSRFSKFVIDSDRGKNVRTEAEYKVIAEQSFNQIECFIRKDLLTVPVELIILRLTKRIDS
jgi:SAM-dependent methyltransferase